MRTLLFIFFGFVFCGTVSSQDATWEQWDQAIIDQANTAKNIGYYCEEEKQIVLLMNLARLDGDLFASTFLTQYLRSTGMAINSYVNSLYRNLKAIEGLPVLHPKRDLSDIASQHAATSGKTGHVGHKGMTERFAPVFGSEYFQMAENCSYGYENAIDIVITLLIDDGIKSLGHRKNILNKEYNYTGVSIEPHTEYRHNCVIDFGGNS